jgi:hypothetical protein
MSIIYIYMKVFIIIGIIIILLFYNLRCKIIKQEKNNIEKFEDICVFDEVKCEKILSKSDINKNLEELKLLYDIIMEQDRTTDNIRIIFNNHYNIILNLLETRFKILDKYHFNSLFKIQEVTDENKDLIIENIINIVETEIEDLEDMLNEIENNPNKYQNLISERNSDIFELENEIITINESQNNEDEYNNNDKSMFQINDIDDFIDEDIMEDQIENIEII